MSLGETISKSGLAEWTENYVKNRDIIVRHIIKIEKKKDGWDLLVHTKSGIKHYLVMPELENIEKAAEKIGTSNAVIVAYNTRKNLDRLMDAWPSLSKIPSLSIMFVNPESELDKKWIIFPHTHDKVTEKASFKRGLKAMFDTVEEWLG